MIYFQKTKYKYYSNYEDNSNIFNSIIKKYLTQNFNSDFGTRKLICTGNQN